MHDVLDLRDLVRDELAQRRESGHVVDGALAAAAESGAGDLARGLGRAGGGAARPRVAATRSRRTWEAVVAARPAAPARGALAPGVRWRSGSSGPGSAAARAARWASRWRSGRAPRSAATSQETGDYPLRDYVPADGPTPAGVPPLNPSWPVSTRGRIREMPRDDDLDYTILGLHLVETHGTGFTVGGRRRGVAAGCSPSWRSTRPSGRPTATSSAAWPRRRRRAIATRTASGSARRSAPTRTATCWPGDPEGAASLAFADASLSHTANGVYGAMWAAALVAAAFAERDMERALASALAVIPARSRLAEALREVSALHDDAHRVGVRPRRARAAARRA